MIDGALGALGNWIPLTRVTNLATLAALGVACIPATTSIASAREVVPERVLAADVALARAHVSAAPSSFTARELISLAIPAVAEVLLTHPPLRLGHVHDRVLPGQKVLHQRAFLVVAFTIRTTSLVLCQYCSRQRDSQDPAESHHQRSDCSLLLAKAEDRIIA